MMNEYINLTFENIDQEHLCCAIADKMHQRGVKLKKEWIKNKLNEGHVFRKLDARGKTFIEYEPIETAWVPIIGENYLYIYCLWVAGSFKSKGIGKELLEYAIKDACQKGKNGICTLTSKKKKPFLNEKKFFEHFGFKVIDSVGDYELLALTFKEGSYPRFSETVRKGNTDSKVFTIYYSLACPYVNCQVEELKDCAYRRQIPIQFIQIDTLEKAKNVPCVFNNWANFYHGKFVSTTLLSTKAFLKIVEEEYGVNQV